MATKVVMEALSPTMEEGRLVKWLKNEGDEVKTGDALAEVETDKAVMELTARGEGVLRKRILAEGESAPVGQLVAVIAAADEDLDALIKEAGAARQPTRPAEEEPAAEAEAPPQRKEGERQPEGEEAAAKAQPAKKGAPAWPSSIPQEPGQAQGEASLPHQERDRRGEARWRRPPAGAPAAEGDGARRAAQDREEAEPVRSSPLARRLASERGLELSDIRGSGPGGRIIKRDVEAAVSGARAGAAPPPARPGTAGADYEDVALTQMRRTIARRLAESIGPIPTFYLTADFDVERIAEMRAAMIELGDEFKVSFNDIILKAVATALSMHPEVNAHWLGDKMRYFYRVHLGLAVAVEDGLITPVIFDADSKRLSEISVEARDLARRARDRKLKPEEYTGATFTVSNLGMFGIDQFTAIINPPEAGILAIGAIEERPIVADGELRTRRRMRLTMSCDHRVIDGATGARFLQTLRRLVENPLMLVY